MADMGHQLQLVGVTLLEDAMTEDSVRVREEQRERERERDREGGREGERARGDFSTTNRASSTLSSRCFTLLLHNTSIGFVQNTDSREDGKEDCLKNA